VDEPRPEFGTLNLPSRAQRVADFLAVTKPGVTDVVMDFGCGSGELGLTVAASTLAQVRGVELVQRYADEASRSAGFLGLGNAVFLQGDARSARVTFEVTADGG